MSLRELDSLTTSYNHWCAALDKRAASVADVDTTWGEAADVDPILWAVLQKVGMAVPGMPAPVKPVSLPQQPKPPPMVKPVLPPKMPAISPGPRPIASSQNKLPGQVGYGR